MISFGETGRPLLRKPRKERGPGATDRNDGEYSVGFEKIKAFFKLFSFEADGARRMGGGDYLRTRRSLWVCLAFFQSSRMITMAGSA